MIEYREIMDQDIPLIVSLFAEYLNGGESISESIREAWKHNELMGYIATEDGKPAGFLTMREGISFTYPHPVLEKEIAGLVQGERIAYCDAILILPEYRCEGVAHRLAQSSRELLRRKGFVYYLSEIWVYPDGQAPSRPILETMGTLVWQKKIDMFYSELDAYDMTCPICGRKCLCGAWIDVMKL